MARFTEVIKRIVKWENIKSVAKFVAFLVGLWTFHWSIDATLQKYEHDVRSEIFHRLERVLIETKIDGSTRVFAPLSVALQAEEEATWLSSIHKLLAHDCWLSNLAFHFKLSSDRSDERKQLEVYEQHSKYSLVRSFELAKNSFLTSKTLRQTNEQTIMAVVDSLIEVEILTKNIRSKDVNALAVAKKLLKDARNIGSNPKIIHALENYEQHLINNRID